MQSRTTLITLAALTLLPATLAAQPDPNALPQAAAPVSRIALFKNGLAYFQATVTPPANADAFNFRPAGAPVHGTFWLAWPEDLAVASILAREVESTATIPAVSYADLLAANPDAHVRIDYEDQTITGRVREVLRAERPGPIRPYELARTPQTEIYPPDFWRRTLVVLHRADEGLAYLEPGRIKSVTFLSGQPVQHAPTHEKNAQLTVTLDAPTGPDLPLTASWLAKGITWAPSYLVDISDPDHARLSAKAALLNEVADFHNVEILLVTGFPHLQFADTLSPITLREDLARFLQSLSQPGERRDAMVTSNVMMQRAYAPEGFGRGAAPDYGPAAVGAQAEDLFLYPAGHLDLPRDATAYVPLFTANIPARHVYTWEIPDYLNETTGYQLRGQRGPEEQAEEIVWHVLRLENTTEMPWTTAPAATVKDNMILGQDTLDFTPPGLEQDLKITRALNILAEQAEHEISRERSATTLYGRQYDLATIEGILSVTNRQDRPVTVEVTKTLSGEVLQTEPSAEIEQPGKGLLELNSMRILKWTLELTPDQSRELTYRYQLYVPR